ncbi:MAG: hypothetical protein EOO10_13725 [Chitinophagaceae bacterium]|nr:MAG: hypothetical protein EOO10_13725 [Chitinophagaceae bacterium]
MNTKFFFLLIATLLISNTTSSLVGSKKENHSIEVVKKTDEVNQGKEQSSHVDMQLSTIAGEDNHIKKTHKPNSEEDGKHHHFHFGRITARNRWNVIVMIISKIILTIAHIACFIYCFQHVFH